MITRNMNFCCWNQEKLTNDEIPSSKVSDVTTNQAWSNYIQSWSIWEFKKAEYIIFFNTKNKNIDLLKSHLF